MLMEPGARIASGATELAITRGGVTSIPLNRCFSSSASMNRARWREAAFCRLSFGLAALRWDLRLGNQRESAVQSVTRGMTATYERNTTEDPRHHVPAYRLGSGESDAAGLLAQKSGSEDITGV